MHNHNSYYNRGNHNSVIGHLSGQVSCLSDNNEDILSNQRVRREPKGLCESDHDVRSIMCMV